MFIPKMKYVPSQQEMESLLSRGFGYFDVELSAGDVISVPVNIPHFFTLMENRKVVAVRLFIDASGWVAHSYEDPEFKS